MSKIPKRSVASVWCGTMPRVGSKNHMYLCQDCKRVRRVYWRVVAEQGNG